jgi:hypothetical protein
MQAAAARGAAAASSLSSSPSPLLSPPGPLPTANAPPLSPRVPSGPPRTPRPGANAPLQPRPSRLSLPPGGRPSLSHPLLRPPPPSLAQPGGTLHSLPDPPSLPSPTPLLSPPCRVRPSSCLHVMSALLSPRPGPAPAPHYRPPHGAPNRPGTRRAPHAQGAVNPRPRLIARRVGRWHGMAGSGRRGACALPRRGRVAARGCQRRAEVCAAPPLALGPGPVPRRCATDNPDPRGPFAIDFRV